MQCILPTSTSANLIRMTLALDLKGSESPENWNELDAYVEVDTVGIFLSCSNPYLTDQLKRSNNRAIENPEPLSDLFRNVNFTPVAVYIKVSH